MFTKIIDPTRIISRTHSSSKSSKKRLLDEVGTACFRVSSSKIRGGVEIDFPLSEWHWIGIINQVKTRLAGRWPTLATLPAPLICRETFESPAPRAFPLLDAAPPLLLETPLLRNSS